MTPSPSDVVVEMFDPESRQKTSRKFSPNAKADDPAGSSRFSTGLIDQDYSSFSASGELKANLNGPISVPF